MIRFLKLCKWPFSHIKLLSHHPCFSLPCLWSSCTCPWTLHWQAVSWPKSPFAGTSVCLRWCWGCQEQPHQTTSSLAASPQMSLPSLRCVKSLEVWYFLTSVPRRWSCSHTTIYFHNHYVSALFLVALINHSVIYDSRASCFSLRAIVLRADTEDAEPVSGVSGAKGSKWCCH